MEKIISSYFLAIVREEVEINLRYLETKRRET
jgi:hypothetical protein